MTFGLVPDPVTTAQAALARIQSQVTEETLLVRVYERNDLHALADAVPDRGHMKPGTLRAALQGENPLRSAIQRLVTPVEAGGAQWTGDEGFSEAEKALVRQLAGLTKEVATQLALYGKAAIFPHYSSEGDERPTLSVVRGFLFPVIDQTRFGALERVLAFLPVQTHYGQSYSTLEFLPGWVRTYRETVAITRYNTGRPINAEQRHAAGRLPLAYRHLELDSEGLPRGPGHHTLGAMRRFVARLAQENIVYNASAGPQRVITGDIGGQGQTFGPYQTIRLPMGADYKLVGPDVSAMSQHTATRREAAGDVLEMAGSPLGIVGAGDSGEARMIAGQQTEQTSTSLGELTAAILTDAADLLHLMGALPSPITFTIRAFFPAKRTAEQQNIILMYEKGLLKRHQALLRLQDVGVKISDEEIEQAKLEDEAEKAQGKKEPEQPSPRIVVP